MDTLEAPIRENAERTAARIRRWPRVRGGLKVVTLVLIGSLVVAFIADWNRWISAAAKQTTDDAYLAADLTPLSAKVPGYLRDVRVRDFQRVRAGEVLADIEDDDYRAQVSQAAADAAAARATIASIDSQKLLQQTLIEQAQATIAADDADLTRYHLELLRQQALLRQGLAGTRQLVEQAVANEKRTAATVDFDHARLAQQRQQLQVLDRQRAQAEATLQARQAAFDLARINLGYTRIVAPVDGEVGQRMVLAGQYVGVGTEIVAIVPLPHVWVIANYKEIQLTHIRLGEPATITVDSFPGVVLHGHVDSYAPASGSEFSLLPPDNATGNFTKVVQRIPVKILIDPPDPIADLLRPGMSVEATIDTRTPYRPRQSGRP